MRNSHLYSKLHKVIEYSVMITPRQLILLARLTDRAINNSQCAVFLLRLTPLLPFHPKQHTLTEQNSMTRSIRSAPSELNRITTIESWSKMAAIHRDKPSHERRTTTRRATAPHCGMNICYPNKRALRRNKQCAQLCILIVRAVLHSDGCCRTNNLRKQRSQASSI